MRAVDGGIFGPLDGTRVGTVACTVVMDMAGFRRLMDLAMELHSTTGAGG